MHELGLMRSILEIAEAHARAEGAEAIHEIGLKVGALSGVDRSALEFAFEAVKQGTLAEQGRLVVQWVPLQAFCEACGLEFEVSSPFGIALCPVCQQVAARYTHGQELEVDYLEVM